MERNGGGVGGCNIYSIMHAILCGMHTHVHTHTDPAAVVPNLLSNKRPCSIFAIHSMETLNLKTMLGHAADV
jgi:hypothetical protein